MNNSIEVWQYDISTESLESQYAFIKRGLAARDKAKSTDQYASKSEVMDSLKLILHQAKQQIETQSDHDQSQ